MIEDNQFNLWGFLLALAIGLFCGGWIRAATRAMRKQRLTPLISVAELNGHAPIHREPAPTPAPPPTREDLWIDLLKRRAELEMEMGDWRRATMRRLELEARGRSTATVTTEIGVFVLDITDIAHDPVKLRATLDEIRRVCR